MKNKKPDVYITVMVAALGYFVDIYDLLLFGIVRVPSLRAIGVPESDLLQVGLRLLNYQMSGMLIGGIIWGVLGDKLGRLSVLFGSILMYSLANIANAFVTDVETYAILRFVAGIGLAGELGAAITLVSETMSKETRGIGTTLVASIGILGAVFASLVGDLFDWKVAYIVGGVMGLLLLLLRVKMLESGMFKSIKSQTKLRKGDLSMLLWPPKRLRLYLSCIFIGVPIWFVIGILVSFSPELALELGVQGTVRASTAIMACYIGLSLGDLSSGLLSQALKSRRKVVIIFLGLTLFTILAYINVRSITNETFYYLCGVLGFSVGYWAVFVTIAAEQFGTNLRATVATTVPNFVRGSVVLVSYSFNYLSQSMPLVQAAFIVGMATLIVAAIALIGIHETFGKDLDFVENI